MSRELESLGFEVDYWRVAIVDLLELNQRIAAAADVLAPVAVAVVELGIVRPLLARPAAFDGACDRALEGLRDGLAELAKMQDATRRLVALTEGRLHALEAELDEMSP